MNQLLSDIKSYMIYSKISAKKLAEMIHKDETTIAKQLDAEKSNPTLASIDVIVQALGAKIVLETAESIKAIEEADVEGYRNRIRELGGEVEKLNAEVSRLREIIAERDARIERVDRMIAEHKETIRKKDAIIDAKEEAIRNKDKLLNDIFRKEILEG